MACRAHMCSLVAVCFLWGANIAPAGQQAPPPVPRVDPPTIIKRVEPEYPDNARRARIAGVVVVKATIGTDGKVSAAAVVQSIPLLDDAALAAVRQWEYEPRVIDGVAHPLTMKTRVVFTLHDKTEARQPLVLSSNGSDWTIDGMPLLDGNLQLWLNEAYTNRHNQHVIVDATAVKTYVNLVRVLGSALDAGVQQLSLFGGNDPKQAVRVILEPVSGPQPDVRLPAMAIEGDPVNPDLVITLAGVTDVARAQALVRGVSRGAVVRLRVDVSRSTSDVWEILRAGQAAGVELFALAVLRPK